MTKHHALVLGSRPPPAFIERYAGAASVETFTVIYGRDGLPTHGIVIARTPAGERLMARVEPEDAQALAVLTDLDRSPVGR